MGKTALATNIAFNAAKGLSQHARGRTAAMIAEDGAVVGFFSLEMSAEQLATRILAEESGVSSDRIRRGEVSREDFDKFVAGEPAPRQRAALSSTTRRRSASPRCAPARAG